jgi:hypothetical protein
MKHLTPKTCGAFLWIVSAVPCSESRTLMAQNSESVPESADGQVPSKNTGQRATGKAHLKVRITEVVGVERAKVSSGADPVAWCPGKLLSGDCPQRPLECSAGQRRKAS